MATFSEPIDFNYQIERAPRVAVAKFGDGYEQRVADGINADLRRFRVTFNTRTTAEADAIDSFLTARAGVESFDWTPPTGAACKVVCREWSRAGIAAGIWNMSAIFDEVAE